MKYPFWELIKITKIVLLCSTILAVSSCSISYKFTGASIDYTTTKSFSIQDFDNQSTLVYPPAAQLFTEELRKLFTRQTKLEEITADGDFSIEGSIVGYDLSPVAVQQDAFAAVTRFTLTVRVNFKNKYNEKKNFNRTFTAYADFDSSNIFTEVQDTLLKELTDNITKQIFNATAEDW